MIAVNRTLALAESRRDLTDTVLGDTIGTKRTQGTVIDDLMNTVPFGINAVEQDGPGIDCGCYHVCCGYGRYSPVKIPTGRSSPRFFQVYCRHGDRDT